MTDKHNGIIKTYSIGKYVVKMILKLSIISCKNKYMLKIEKVKFIYELKKGYIWRTIKEKRYNNPMENVNINWHHNGNFEKIGPSVHIFNIRKIYPQIPGDHSTNNELGITDEYVFKVNENNVIRKIEQKINKYRQKKAIDNGSLLLTKSRKDLEKNEP